MINMYICMRICIYVYISLSLSLYIYIYIYNTSVGRTGLQTSTEDGEDERRQKSSEDAKTTEHAEDVHAPRPLFIQGEPLV